MPKKLLIAAVVITAVCYSYKICSRSNNQHSLSVTDNLKSYSADETRHRFGDYLVVSTNSTGVRLGAGSNYELIQTVDKNDILKVLASYGQWYKVLVIGTNNIGYVYGNSVE